MSDQSELAPLAMVLLTYARTDYAVRTIESARANLRYQGDIVWYVADDGSPQPHLDAIDQALAGATVLGKHTARASYGASANWALRAAYAYTDVAFVLEDDWTLAAPYDLTRHVRTLRRHSDLGMFRFAYLPVGQRGEVIGRDGIYYLLLDWGPAYVFSGNPSLRHRRAFETWGPYPEGQLPGPTECAYDSQVQAARGPRIAWAMDVGEWGIFGHIGQVPSYTVTP